jgi:integrase
MKAPYRLKPYNDNGRPHLKFVINFKEKDQATGQTKRARRFFETKIDAKTFLEKENIRHLNEGKEGAEFPSWLRVMASDCNALLTPFGKTLRDATDHYLTFLRALSKSCNVADLVAELLKAKKSDGASERYLSDLKSRLGRFAADFNGTLVATITGPQIDDWLRLLKQSSASRNNFRRVVIVMFNFAVQRGYATNNPAEKTAKAKEVDEAPGILTVAEVARLMESAEPDVLPYLAIGCFAGLRPAELARMDWSAVHFDAGLIEVTAKKAKSSRRRFIKIQPNLANWLASYRASRGPVCGMNLRKRLEATRRAAGLKEWPNDALRHSFASYHLAHFNDVAALALEMGHKDADMIFGHFRQLVRPAEAAKFWNIAPLEDGKVTEIGKAA